MDVKTGSGAFMPNHEASRDLALSITKVANTAGVKTTALLTDMNQCLGRHAGNALEVREAIEFLTGKHQGARLKEVVFALCSELLMISKLAASQNDATAMLEDTLASGKAAEVFGKMTSALGGPTDLMDNYDSLLPKAPVIRPLMPENEGFVTAIDTRALGLCVVKLGGGRTRAEDPIDPAVGLEDVISIGDSSDQPLATIHARDEQSWQVAANTLRAAITFKGSHEPPPPVIHETFS